ncbi:MAG TPA: head GIN domain-containing protein [Bacteroidales bacterium]|nr:head GIN domain-containing protein [Bacteroidales bacterium]
MKNLRFIAVTVAIFAFTACTSGQFRKTVYGNHDVVTKDRNLGSFTAVKASSGVDVYITQGDAGPVAVEADENLQEYIRTEVRNGELNVYTDANIRRAERMRVYVTMPEIRSLRSTSAGNIIGQSAVKSDKLDLSASSAGDLKLEVYTSDLRVNISSSGDMTLSGEADKLDADLSSAGDLNAYDLEVREAYVSVSSAGDADVNVTEKITARASSAGDINYRGNPKYVDFHSSSAGGIHKR